MEMAEVEVRDMGSADEYFVSTCSHVNESDEIDACGQRRLAWLRKERESGLRIKVGLVRGEHAGFLYVMPIETSPWGPLGQDLSVIPCLYVLEKGKGKGLGQALIGAAEEVARIQGKKGLVVAGHYHDFWFMPAPFFEKCGFSVARRQDNTALLWKVWDTSAEVPSFLESQCRFEPVADKVIVDLFWNTFCETSDIEAERVREVVAEFPDSVVLREYCSDDTATLRCYQTPRAIFINGEPIDWGYEAPKEGIRDALSRALSNPKTPLR